MDKYKEIMPYAWLALILAVGLALVLLGLQYKDTLLKIVGLVMILASAFKIFKLTYPTSR